MDSAALPIAIFTFVVLVGLSITIFIIMYKNQKKSDALLNDLIQQVNSTQTYLYQMIKDNKDTIDAVDKKIENLKVTYSCVKCPTNTQTCQK